MMEIDFPPFAYPPDHPIPDERETSGNGAGRKVRDLVGES
jgi:hypothetical protein